MYTLGNIPGISDYNIVVKGTGDSTTDNNNLAAAVSTLNGWGKGTLWIDGEVYVTTTKAFTAPIHMKGINNDAKIIVTNTSADFAAFTWNTSFSPFSMSPLYTISTSKQRSEYVSTSGTGYTPSDGDWVVVWSNDTLTDVDPHESGGAAKPMELHEVTEYDSAALRAYFADPIIDILSTSGRLAVIDLQDEVVVENLTMEHSGSQTDYQSALVFKKINGVKVRNIHMVRHSPGAIWATFCANVDISNVFYEGVEANEYVYGVVVGVVNGFTFRDSTVYGTRHGFTTTAGASSGTTRWGTPLNCVIDNVTMHVPSKIDASNTKTTRVGLDTHAEGYGIVFQDCNVHVQGDTANVGIQTRSRNTVFKNCKIMGSYSTDTGNGAKGLRIYGKNAVVQDCLFDGLWRAVETAYVWNSGLTNNAIIENCIIRNMSHQGIILNDGSGHQINNCTFRGCGAVNIKTIIDFNERKSGHKVTNCVFNKDAANAAINTSTHAVGDIKVIGNVFMGFAQTSTCSGPLGFYVSGAYGPDFEQAYSYSNFYDNISYGGRKTGQDALGSISGTQLINFASGTYDNKTAVLTGNLTLTASGKLAGEYYLLVSQDVTGGKSITWSNVNWNGTDPVPASGSLATSLFQLYHDSAGGWYGLGYFNN